MVFHLKFVFFKEQCPEKMKVSKVLFYSLYVVSSQITPFQTIKLKMKFISLRHV